MTSLPERIRMLDVTVDSQRSGDLLHQSQFVYRYAVDDPAQPRIGLLMPASTLVHTGNALFPVMDQNLPEGYLFQRIRDAFPKQPLSLMHLLALFGSRVCGVLRPAETIGRIADAMRKTLRKARRDARIPVTTLQDMADRWDIGLHYEQKGAIAS